MQRRASSEPPRTAATTEPTNDEPSRRCGNIYWYCYNIGLAAIAVESRIDLARAHLENAIGHAKLLAIPPNLMTDLLALRRHNLFDPVGRGQFLTALGSIWARVGKYVEAQQPRFAETDPGR